MGTHKYELLAEKLRGEILDGTYPCGRRLPSENQLVMQTGYSRQTVRQAMSILEREGFTLRVRGSGTYVCSATPKRTCTHNIAVVTTYIGEYIFPNILRGISDVLDDSGYSSMLFATGNRVDNERRILKELLQKPIDGLIVEGTKTALPNPNIDLYEQLSRQEIPIVFINGFYPELKRHVSVVADDRAGGRIACEALLRRGHSKIAGIFKSDDIQGHRRYAGYTEALVAAGVSVNDDNVLWYTTENRESLIASCAIQTLADCTGVVCYNDMITLQLLRVLSAHNIRVPAQVEPVSFDSSTFAALSAIPFQSLSNPKEQLGRLAAQKLLRLLDGKSETSAIMPWTDVQKKSEWM